MPSKLSEIHTQGVIEVGNIYLDVIRVEVQVKVKTELNLKVSVK